MFLKKDPQIRMAEPLYCDTILPPVLDTSDCDRNYLLSKPIYKCVLPPDYETQYTDLRVQSQAAAEHDDDDAEEGKGRGKGSKGSKGSEGGKCRKGGEETHNESFVHRCVDTCGSHQHAKNRHTLTDTFVCLGNYQRQ